MELRGGGGYNTKKTAVSEMSDGTILGVGVPFLILNLTLVPPQFLCEWEAHAQVIPYLIFGPLFAPPTLIRDLRDVAFSKEMSTSFCFPAKTISNVGDRVGIHQLQGLPGVRAKV